MSTNDRLDRLRRLMADQKLDLLLIGQSENRHYLSGFRSHDPSPTAGAGWLVIGPDHGCFLTSFLYYEAVAAQVHDLEVLRAPMHTKMIDALAETLGKTTGARIGFEGSWITYDWHAELAQHLTAGRELVAVDGLVEQLRQVKDAAELDRIRAAAVLTDAAYHEVVDRLRPGQTEKQVAWALERVMRDGGADGMAFPPAVAAGPHSAVPHHTPTDRPIRVGEPVWIDMGAQLDGYCADLTRSFCLGQADSVYHERYELVVRAQEAALAGLKPELTGQQADALARDVIAAAGHGDDFGHSLGHGVGLAIHEAPRLARTSEDTLVAGMMATIEPGIYVAGWGGIRIEDLTILGDEGPIILSAAKKEMVLNGGRI